MERTRRKKKKLEKEGTSFFRDSYKYTQQLLDKARSVKLGISERKLGQHIKSQYSDDRQATPLDSPGHAPQPAPPKVLFDISPPKLQEVE